MYYAGSGSQQRSSPVSSGVVSTQSGEDETLQVRVMKQRRRYAVTNHFDSQRSDRSATLFQLCEHLTLQPVGLHQATIDAADDTRGHRHREEYRAGDLQVMTTRLLRRCLGVI